MLEQINELLWGRVVLFLILGAGIWVTIATRGAQIRLFPDACREFWNRMRSRDSGFRALCTALAATVGTGNIAGVAGAIAIGGPGAVFWMWASGLLGMGLKLAESVLAVRFREKDGKAGPMYIIRHGLGERWRWMGWLYSLFGICAAFGVGNATQINAVRATLESAGVSRGFTVAAGVVLAVAVAWMIMGGAGAVANGAELLMPVVGGTYVVLCLAACVLRWERLASAFWAILVGAFEPSAVTGGAVGSVLTTLRLGVSRGTFTNEAGMGTAAIAHGSAETSEPAKQGLLGIMEVFLDTMVICTLTALVILTSDLTIPYGCHAGAELTGAALTASVGRWTGAALCACMTLFALATILGWGFYAGRCAEYLFGRISWKLFGLLQGCAVLLGLFLDTRTVWTMAEIVNALMAVPNLTAILMLTGQLRRALGIDHLQNLKNRV